MFLNRLDCFSRRLLIGVWYVVFVSAKHMNMLINCDYVSRSVSSWMTQKVSDIILFEIKMKISCLQGPETHAVIV
jgi:hypothetical protein